MKDISLHILDIVENSIVAQSKQINIDIIDSISSDILKLTITDNGTGISKELLEKVVDPFYTSRTTRKVGLGLSLLKQKAEQAGGSFNLRSEIGKGTEVYATFQHSHIDRPPLGNTSSVISLLAINHPSICIIYNHSTDSGSFTFNSEIVLEIFKDDAIGYQIRKSIEEFISDNLRDIKYES